MSKLLRKATLPLTVALVLAALVFALSALGTVHARAEAEAMPQMTLTGVLPPARVLTGTNITAPVASAVAADGTTPLDVTMKVMCGKQDVTHSDGNREYTLQKGEYTFYYEAYDEATDYYAYTSFRVDVRDVWLTIEIEGEHIETGKIGNPYTLAPAKAYVLSGDEAGVPVSVQVFLSTQEIEKDGNTFIPQIRGNYRIVYTAEKQGEVATAERLVTITGVRPNIVVKNMPATGVVGQTITLPRAQVYNSDGTFVSVSVAVTQNGTAVPYENMQFVPAVAGEYKVVYTAVNKDDIPATAEFTITVGAAGKQGGCGSVLAGGTAAVAALAAATGGVLLAVRRKKTGK